MSIAKQLREEAARNSMFRRTQPQVDASYPAGRYIAMSKDGVIADADTFEQLLGTLEAQGKDPSEVLVFQAGVHYPEQVFILSIRA